MLNLIDEFTHECLAIRVDRKLKSADVIDVLSDQFVLRGVPEHIRSDNGPEFVAIMARTLFPTGLPAKRQPEYYVSQFETVELNGVFYRTPTAEAVGRWRDQTGRHFVFSWKASKFITHWKRLSENSLNSLQLLDDRLSILGQKVGPILFQLPDFEADAGRLGSFLTLLPEHRRYAFEFRHPSWYARNILRTLADRNIALYFRSPRCPSPMGAHR